MKVTRMSAFDRNEPRALPRLSTAPPVEGGNRFLRLFASFGTDDYILLGIIAVLIMEGCDDYVLLAALGYLFIMGLRE